MIGFPPEIDFSLWDLLRFRINDNIPKAAILRCFQDAYACYYPDENALPYKYKYFLIN